MEREKWFRSWEEEKAWDQNPDGTWRTGAYVKETALFLGIGIIIILGIMIYLAIIW